MGVIEIKTMAIYSDTIATSNATARFAFIKQLIAMGADFFVTPISNDDEAVELVR